MGKLNLNLQTIFLMFLGVFVSIQTVKASSKAGEATVYEGSTVKISLADTYKRTLMNSTNISYQWYSENNSYVTVTNSTKYDATVKGIKATSSCKVYFKCSYRIDGFYRTMDFYYTITVKSKNVSVDRVSLSYSSIRITEGNTFQLTASVYPSNATNKSVNWSSNKTKVATVNSHGLVTAKSSGTATITCMAADGSGKYATCDVYVEPATVYVSNISLDKTSESLKKGETLQLTASVSPSSATDKSVGWTSDNTSVASVSSNGLVTAKSAGNAVITCTAKDGSGKYATCYLTVWEDVAPESVSLSCVKATLMEDEILQLTATVSPEDATDKSLIWMSDNTDIATVSATGLVTAKKEGVANIIVTTVNNLAAICTITVEKKIVGKNSEWQGHYRVLSSHVESNPTREYPDDFEMTIEKKGDICYVTSLFGEDLTRYNDGGFKILDNGDGTANIDVSYYNILKYTDNDSPLYTLYVFDEVTEDWSETWSLTMNEDSSISLGDFYVIAFYWAEENIWKNGQLEALYYNLVARPEEVNGISESKMDDKELGIHITNGAIMLDEVTNITIYRDNGMMVYSGDTNCVENLSKGLYFVRTGNQSRKVVIK